MSFIQYLEEDAITKSQIDYVEKYADQLFKVLNIDVELTKHFFDRVNNARNGKQITVHELIDLFNKQFQTNGQKMKNLKGEVNAVLKDIATDINSPVTFEWIPSKRMMEMRLKTVMRKKNFHSPDKEFKA